MEQMIQLARTLYMQYRAELALGLLAVIAVLMIITLFAVRRCQRQVRRLNENTREYIKISMSQAQAAGRREDTALKAAGPQRERRNTPEDEEVFGSVIQEMFS